VRKSLSLCLVFALVVLTMSPPAPAAPRTQTAPQSQDVSAKLTNKDVVGMLNAGLSADVVIAKIKSSATDFDTSAAALQELKSANVPDAVILTMVQSPGGASAPAASPSANSAPAAAGATAEVKVPDGTEIEIELKSNASGEQLKVGDVVDFSVTRPVVVGGVMIFDKGASARARITTAKRAGHWGKAGKLEWAMQDVQAVDGARVPARFTQRATGDSKGGTVAVAAVATTVLLGPLGLLWGLKKGKPSIIPAGNRYKAFVHGDTSVKGRAASAAPTQ
jgi:hypothetical protein